MKKILLLLAVSILMAAGAQARAYTVVQINGKTVVNTANGSAVSTTNGAATNTIVTPCGGTVARKSLSAAEIESLQQRIMELMQKIAALRTGAGVSRTANVITKEMPSITIPKIDIKVNTGNNANTVSNTATTTVTANAGANTLATASSPVATNTTFKNDIFTATNKERVNYLGSGHELKQGAVLERIAADRVADMFKNQYFSHSSPTGATASNLAKQYGYLWSALGENIAYGSYANGAMVVKAWMNSSGHKANILSSYFTEIGVAAAYGNYKGRNAWIAVQVFGRPQK